MSVHIRDGAGRPAKECRHRDALPPPLVGKHVGNVTYPSFTTLSVGVANGGSDFKVVAASRTSSRFCQPAARTYSYSYAAAPILI